MHLPYQEYKNPQASHRNLRVFTFLHCCNAARGAQCRDYRCSIMKNTGAKVMLFLVNTKEMRESLCFLNFDPFFLGNMKDNC